MAGRTATDLPPAKASGGSRVRPSRRVGRGGPRAALGPDPDGGSRRRTGPKPPRSASEWRGLLLPCLLALCLGANGDSRSGTASPPAVAAPGDASGGGPQAGGAAAEGAAERTARVPPPIVYVPPDLGGAPAGRIGAGTRGADPAGPAVRVLGPPGVGLTAREAPTVFWVLEAAAREPVEIRIVDPLAGTARATLRLDPPVAPGLRRLELGEAGIALAPDEEVELRVAVLRDPHREDRNPRAVVRIRRVPPPPGVSGEDPRALARAGIFYDALAPLVERAASSPPDRGAARLRDSLLEQAGLLPLAAVPPRGAFGLP